MKTIPYLIACLFLTSCFQTFKKNEPFPAKPDFQRLTKEPLIGVTPKGNYEVTKEFVTRATQEHEWIKSILEWKDKLIFN